MIVATVVCRGCVGGATLRNIERWLCTTPIDSMGLSAILAVQYRSAKFRQARHFDVSLLRVRIWPGKAKPCSNINNLSTRIVVNWQVITESSDEKENRKKINMDVASLMENGVPTTIHRSFILVSLLFFSVLLMFSWDKRARCREYITQQETGIDFALAECHVCCVYIAQAIYYTKLTDTGANSLWAAPVPKE